MIPPFACAAFVAQPTLSAVVQVESAGNPLAINVNGVGRFAPATSTEALAIARHFIERGVHVDIGLMQVDSANLPALGYSIRMALDPCANMRAGGIILAIDYQRALARGARGQAALAAALSAYNTGSLISGFLNGYVARYRLAVGPADATTPAGAPMTVYHRTARKKRSDTNHRPHASQSQSPSMTVYKTAQ